MKLSTHSLKLQISSLKRKTTKKAKTDKFPLLELNDDLIILILSFVSYAPFEMSVVHDNNQQSSSLLVEQNKKEMKYLTKAYNSKRLFLELHLCKKKRRKNSLAPDVSLVRYYSNNNSSITASSPSPPTSSSSLQSSSSFAPMSDYRNFGTLTHVFPFINKRFYMLCNNTSPSSSVLWMEALERITRMDTSGVWKKGLITVMESLDRRKAEGLLAPEEAHQPEHDEEPLLEPTETLFDPSDNRVQEFIRNYSRNNMDDCCNTTTTKGSKSPLLGNTHSNHHQDLFQQVCRYKPQRLPIFLMRHNNITLGEPISLYLFEPRYRIMMKEIMANRSFGECSGLPIHVPRPRFLFSCFENPEQRGAYFVEVHNCTMHKNGTANVTLIPTAWTKIETIVSRQEANGLLEGIVVISPPTTRTTTLA